MRFGQRYQISKQEMQNSLFGAFGEGVEIAQPPVPKNEERWSDIERLNKERDLVGIYLSAHPLDEYKIILDNLCNARCMELADRGAALRDRDDVTLGGIVTAVQTRYGRDNKQWGLVTLEDFEGSGELAIFGDDWFNLALYHWQDDAAFPQLRTEGTEDPECRAAPVGEGKGHRQHYYLVSVRRA